MSARWGRRGVPHHTRARVLTRDDGICQLQLPGCTTTATEVDHIVAVSVLGVDRSQANDERQLRAVCRPCHARKTEQEKQAAKVRSDRRRAARRHLPVKPHPGTLT